jgi:hypothetical protein
LNDLEVGDAGALALAGFELQQEGAAVGLDAAQLVEVGVEAFGDHAAVAAPWTARARWRG